MSRLLRSVALGGLVATASLGPVGAQTLPSVGPGVLADVVVTGSRIPTPAGTTISPVYTVDATLIQQSGVTRIEDLLNSLPQVTADQGANAVITSDGTAAVNLRGFGSQRTLVLVNGRRLGPGDPGGGNQSDLNAIPAELVERIEVLTGGASTVYGADAVAGVVNFKLLDHFDGVKLRVNYDLYSHSNDNIEGVVDALNSWNASTGSQYPAAPEHANLGATKTLSLLAGMNTPDGNGNATFYATYRGAAAVLQSQYSYTACPLASGYLGPGGTDGKFQCAGSSTGYPGAFWALNTQTGQLIGGKQTIGAAGLLLPFTSANFYNYDQTFYFQRPDERYMGGGFLHYDLNEHAIAFAEMQYMRDRTNAQIAPSALFFGTSLFNVNCNNPELSASMISTWCGGSTAGDAALFIGRRNVEGGGRRTDYEHTSWRLVVGIRGRIDDAWQYDVSGQFSTVHLNEAFYNDLSLSRVNNALNVVNYNAATGATGVDGIATCTSALPASLSGTYPNAGSDPGCVPFNIFRIGSVSSRALDYLAIAESSQGTAVQQILGANVTGDLGMYGVRVPTAKAGVKVNVGVEWREVRSAYHPDLEEQSGDGAGFGAPVLPVAGGVIARELFTEVQVPLMDARWLAKSLNLEMGYRFSRYALGYDTNTYKFGLDWAPAQDIRFRGSWSRAVRAPNVSDLYSARLIGGDGSTDPCSGTTPQYSLALCERTGVLPAQYGNIAASPDSGYNGLTGGNPQLRPETATTTSFGIGWSPASVPGLRLQVDYYDIEIVDVIQTIGADTILQQCLDLDLFCNLIHRDAFGSLWLSTNGYVSDVNANVGTTNQKGVDLDASYRFDAGAYGRVLTNVIGTYVHDFVDATRQDIPQTRSDCAGFYGPLCGPPTFRWRHTGRVTWETPWRSLELSLAWRYFAPVLVNWLSPNPNLAASPGSTVANGGISNTDVRLSSRSYFDFSAAAQLTDRVTCRVGVNNLLDKDPPVVGASDAGANVFPQIYDSLGRYVFATISARF